MPTYGLLLENVSACYTGSWTLWLPGKLVLYLGCSDEDRYSYSSSFIIAYDLSGNSVLISNFNVSIRPVFSDSSLTYHARPTSTPLRSGIKSCAVVSL
jgi:hypothetical protein